MIERKFWRWFTFHLPAWNMFRSRCVSGPFIQFTSSVFREVNTVYQIIMASLVQPFKSRNTLQGFHPIWTFGSTACFSGAKTARPQLTGPDKTFMLFVVLGDKGKTPRQYDRNAEFLILHTDFHIREKFRDWFCNNPISSITLRLTWP